ncbi:MAG: KOW domain-containing RNA-binding protein [Firmicutes bacterium]|nr:KOW domain-containing RNA-binding protein [Bacillota bacterium]
MVGYMDGFVGTICISRAGHDKGMFYLIVRELDKNHVGVANGRNRTMAKPKRKNIRHLYVTRARVEEVERLLNHEPVGGNLKLVAILDAVQRG